MKKYLFFLVGIIGMLALALTTYIFARAFFLIDISKAPVQKEIKEPVYLVSYADGPEVFHQNQKMLAYSGLQHGISHFFNYKKHLLDPTFVEKHKEVLALKRGAGYWVWKPWIIRDALKKTPENAYIIYCDSGFVILRNPQPVLNLLKTYDVLLIGYESKNTFTQQIQTKKEALTKTGCTTSRCLNSYAILSGVILIKNTPRARKFIQTWLDLCEQKYLLLDGEGLNLQDERRTEFHRHDQSLLGITYYLHPQGIAILSAEQVAFKNYFRLHHRHPAEADHSLVNKIGSGIRNWEFRIIDSAIFRWIARLFYQGLSCKN